jgi:hypothetical protein
VDLFLSITITINDLVIMKDERLPLVKWKLRRVIHLHPGPHAHLPMLSDDTSGWGIDFMEVPMRK